MEIAIKTLFVVIVAIVVVIVLIGLITSWGGESNNILEGMFSFFDNMGQVFGGGSSPQNENPFSSGGSGSEGGLGGVSGTAGGGIEGSGSTGPLSERSDSPYGIRVS